MKDFIQRHWINALGLIFFFIALLYFLKLAVANGWFPIELRLALSTLLGCCGLFFGFRQHQAGKPIFGQTLAGLGTAVLYATIGYISFSDDIHWSNGSLLVAMVGISSIVSVVAIRQQQRILFGLSILGGLVTPFVIKASASMDIPLFIYVLILNVAAIYAGISRGWKENILGAFVLTIGLFSSYYLLFDPVDWQRPFVYVTCLFGLFMIGFLIIPFWENKKYDGLELLLVVVNGINYVLWSYWIFSEFSLPHVVPLLIVGLLYMGLACTIYYRSEKRGMVAFGTLMLVSLITLGVAGNDLTLLNWGGGLNYAITAGVWMLLVHVVFTLGKKLKDATIIYTSLAGYALLIIYWFATAWSVDWIPIFGIEYIPFINIGSLIWFASIVMGFRMALHFKSAATGEYGKSEEHAAALMSMVSHVQIGGLLTIQISNLWWAYDMKGLNFGLTLSLVWFVYALVIFAWNSRLPHVLFRWFGGAVLIVSSLKVIFLDLGASSSVQKILFLLALGGISLIIARIKSRSDANRQNISEELVETE